MTMTETDTETDTVETATPAPPLQAGLTARLVARRSERAHTILTTLRRLAPGTDLGDLDGTPDAFDNAVLHHAFQQAQIAARTRDADRARRAVELWQNRAALRAEAVPTAVGPVMVVRAADCEAVDDDRLGSQMYLLGTSPEQDAAERSASREP